MAPMYLKKQTKQNKNLTCWVAGVATDDQPARRHHQSTIFFFFLFCDVFCFGFSFVRGYILISLIVRLFKRNGCNLPCAHTQPQRMSTLSESLRKNNNENLHFLLSSFLKKQNFKKPSFLVLFLSLFFSS